MKEITVYIVDSSQRMTGLPFLSDTLRKKNGNTYPMIINGQGTQHFASNILCTPSLYTLKNKSCTFCHLHLVHLVC